jgi:hypothetical protein
MAEVYEVVIDNETPVEITGGRVGQFTVASSSFWIGGQDIAVVPTMDGEEQIGITIEDGVAVSGVFQFYVTSPDEVFALISAWFTGQHYNTSTLKILHNR